jgi:hypothetical protein
MFYKYLIGLFSLIIVCLSTTLYYQSYLSIKNVPFFYDNLAGYFNETDKIHVSYVHHIDSERKEIMDNFKFFMFFGVQPCDSRIDYRIILNMNNISDDINNKVAKVLADDELMSQIKNCSNVVMIKNNNTKEITIHQHNQME